MNEYLERPHIESFTLVNAHEQNSFEKLMQQVNSWLSDWHTDITIQTILQSEAAFESERTFTLTIYFTHNTCFDECDYYTKPTVGE